MTRNRFNQAKHKSTSKSTNNLTLSKARGLFLEDNGDIDMKDTCGTVVPYFSSYSLSCTK